MIRISEMKAEDIPALWEIEKEIWTDENAPNLNIALSLENYTEHLTNQNVLVAKNSSELLGFIAYSHPTSMLSHRRQWTLSIGIAKKVQRKGVGKKLIKALVAKAAETDIQKISLHVMATNQTALAFYQELGFVQEGYFKNEFWINDHWIDDYQFAYYLDEKN